jgi:hypothetical protein
MAALLSTLAVMTSSLSGKTRSDIVPPHTLSIRLYNQAQAPAAVLRAATAEAGRLFRAVHLSISWECPSQESPEDQGTDMSGAPSRQADNRGYIVVRLVRRTPATVLPRALGFALPFAHTGAHVSIFYDRVEAVTRGMNAVMYVVLGHAMAHEIAHVLLGSTEHSAGGLMQNSWTSASWRLASQGLLTFRREEMERMHEGFRRFQPAARAAPRELTLASSAAAH